MNAERDSSSVGLFPKYPKPWGPNLAPCISLGFSFRWAGIPTLEPLPDDSREHLSWCCHQKLSLNLNSDILMQGDRRPKPCLLCCVKYSPMKPSSLSHVLNPGLWENQQSLQHSPSPWAIRFSSSSLDDFVIRVEYPAFSQENISTCFNIPTAFISYSFTVELWS